MRFFGKESYSSSRRVSQAPSRRARLLFPALIAAATLTSAAEAAVERSLVKSQEASSAMLRGRFDLAITAYDEALKEGGLPPARQAPLYSDRGVAKWRLKQLDGALADLTKAISLNGEYAPAYNNRGNVYLEMNRIEDAYRDFDRAIALSPDFGPAYCNRANVATKLQRFEAAEKDFRKAVELMPASAIPFNGRGKIAIVLKRYYTGLRYLNRSITLNAQYAPAYRNRARVYAALKRNDEAAQDLDKVIALTPDNVDLYVARGQAYARDKRLFQAFRDFSKAIELAPENVPALIGLASQNIERKRADLALEELNRAINLDPKAAEAYFWRGQIRYSANDADGAEADLSKAIELDGSFSEAYRIRGWIKDRAGKREEAVADYRRALEFDPFSREARDAYKAASGDTADSVIKPLAAAVDGWEVFRSATSQFTAVNEHYPKMPVLLETERDGPVEIVEWTPLKDSLSGIGLLRYRAGDQKMRPLEYVAIIDLVRNQVAGIEPYIVGDAKSKWAWTQNAVTVTDPDGLATYYELRKPRNEVPSARRDDQSVFGGRSGSGGLFGWLFQ